MKLKVVFPDPKGFTLRDVLCAAAIAAVLSPFIYALLVAAMAY